MIVDLMQIKTFKDLEWVFEENKNNVALAQSPFEVGKYQIFVTFKDDKRICLYYNPRDTTHGGKLENRLAFHIYDDNEYAGHIVGRTKGFLFKGYAYYEMKYKGELYLCYEVGKGKQGLFLCIYKEEELIAIVEKDLTVSNYKDTYSFYILSSEYFVVTSLFTLYYDSLIFNNMLDRSVHSSSTTIKFTRNKELLSKLDASFIEKVKELENI